MLVHRLLLLLFALSFAALWSGAFRAPAAMQAKPAESRSSPVLTPKPEWQGVASCASTACHGGNGPKGSKGSEYTTWALYDKHTKAYLILLDERSRIIEKNLRRLKSLEEARAEKDQLCLRCHAMNADSGPQRESFVRDFGIGCESCHGPAHDWIGVHYASGWKSRSDSEKLKLGFQSMNKLTDRARLCASCHVGDADKEVNHDLIAAGHPRLNFEFGAFQAIMPKHWREQGENAGPDFEARAWAVGQVVSAQAALTLLAHRAEPSSQPWPEFAEYDCFACHHELAEPSWRQKPAHYANRTPGSLPWSAWYYAMLPRALPAAGKDDAQIVAMLNELKKEMEKSTPSQRQIADRARAANAQLGRLLNSMEKARYQRTAVAALFNSIRQDEQTTPATSWDRAAQVYLALAALYNSLGDMDPGQRDSGTRDQLKAWAKQLEFPRGYDSPRRLESK